MHLVICDCIHPLLPPHSQISGMEKPWATELTLLLAIVSYGNSLFLICEHFLMSYQLTMLLTLVSLTCCFLIIRGTLKMKESFEAQYWNFFYLMAAYLSTNGGEMNFNFFTGWVTFLLGLAILIFFHTVYTCVRFLWRGQEPRPAADPKNSVPLLVNVSFVFMGNGVAIMSRWFLPDESFERMIVGGGFMFFTSIIFFSYYYLHSDKN